MSASELVLRDPDVRFARAPSWLASAASLILFAGLPAVLTTRLMFQHGFGWDFRAFYDGAHAYLHGGSPYPADTLAALADKQKFVYPAPTALLFVPLALLPYPAALALWVVISLVAVAVALYLLGIRDWRCFGALMLTLPAEHSLRLGTLEPLLLLLLALLWRYRDRALLAAALAAVVALSKIFLSPLIVWLVLTRRLRAALLATAAVVVLCLLAWLPLGEATMLSYPGLLHTLAAYEQTFSYSLTSLLVAFGASSTTTAAIAWTAAVSLLWIAYLRRSDDELVFRLALAACFLLSPIVWGHYFLLLAVPLALRWPKLGPAWVLAIWIKSDTLALQHASLFVALALTVMAVQLDLLPRLHDWTWLGPARVQIALLLAAVAAVQLASLSSAESGYTRSAALTVMTGSQRASGAGLLRIDRAQHQLCWRVWIDGVGSRAAAITVHSRRAAGRVVAFTTPASTQAEGCATLPRADRAVLHQLVSTTALYRLIVTLPGHTVLAGKLTSQ